MPSELTQLWPSLKGAIGEEQRLPAPYLEDDGHSDAVRSLLRAVQLQPSSSSEYRALAHQIDSHPVPHTVRVEVLQHAVGLNPRDVSLRFKHANALLDEVEHHTSKPNRSLGEGHDLHIRDLRKRAVAAVRKLTRFDEGRFSPTLHCSLGLLLHNLGKEDDALEAFGRALVLLMRSSLGLKPDASCWKSVLREGYLQSLPQSSLPQLAAVDRKLTRHILHGLDCVLQKQGGKQQRRRAPRVHAAGVALQIWPHVWHRPRDITSGQLVSCSFYRRQPFLTILHSLESAAVAMRAEVLAMLRRVVQGDLDESQYWYTNQEGISRRASEWLQRHVGCQRRRLDDGSLLLLPQSATSICKAVEKAMGWYYGRGGQHGMPDPMDNYYGRISISLLGPGSHVKPHTGPTNQRVVFSFGLAGHLEGSELRVGRARRHWSEGKALIFDDSLEHEVRVPNGTEPRLVLIMHLLHPQLMPRGTNGRDIAEAIESDAYASQTCEEGNYGMVDWVAAEERAMVAQTVSSRLH